MDPRIAQSFSVYNVSAKKWIAPSQSVESIEQGKLKAATYAEAYLKQVANLELPLLKWKEPTPEAWEA
jgi:hypothetical protein